MSFDDLFGDNEIEDGVNYNYGFTQNLYNNSAVISYPNDININSLVLLLTKFNKTDIVTLIEEIINNKSVIDGSPVVFFIFQSFFKNNLDLQMLTEEEIINLDFVTQIIKRLKTSNKFNHINFAKTFFSNCDANISLIFIWWLHKEHIIYLEQYWDAYQPLDLIDKLIKIAAINENKEILEGILVELLSSCYSPRTGICRLHKSKLWSSFCSNILNDFIEKYFISILKEKNQEFNNFLPLITGSLLLPYNFKKRFCISILQKLVTFENGEFDMNSAFLFQCLWTMENTPEKLENVLKEVFSDYCDFNDVMEIFKKCDNNINWKYLLTVIAACAKHSKASQKQLQKTVHDNLLSMFKGGKISDFKTAILLIRQATLEKQMDLKYDIWFSNTFGVNTTFITAENQTIFKFFVDCLHNVVSLESEAFLEIHINRAIRAPPKCNALMLEYKNICKSRLKQLKKYPSIVLMLIYI
ncbi:uncharacterized protein LOC108739600 isoform X2 [Agrilus planipennis]|uniref:Uncharacterized protein LOC108739600 isoform X2 n=1 Tax=Agrilus planipennis TaxID=224129 RepID=A0A1W4WZ36_AGRPL|nr:uncharacterized protein LOC108739600 isoform X2 [Agrilus planipennis]